MKFTPKFVAIDINMAAYKKALFNSLVNINERAGQAWIKAAVDETPIPTWSGASRATFQNLAQLLGTSVPIGPINVWHWKGSPTSPRGYYDGVSMGHRASKGSGLVKDKGRMFMGFKYRTTLAHLLYNESNLAAAPGPNYPEPKTHFVRYTPYFFQFRAWDAWDKIAKQAKLPDPMRYITRRPIK